MGLASARLAAFPMTGFAASADGSVLYAGATDGLFRSADGGRSLAKPSYSGSAFAVATSADGRMVAVVSSETLLSDQVTAAPRGPVQPEVCGSG